jgi:hypothetical protein
LLILRSRCTNGTWYIACVLCQLAAAGLEYCALQSWCSIHMSTEGKAVPGTGHKVQRGSKGIALPFFNLGARQGCTIDTSPSCFTPWEGPGTHCIVGWVGPRAGLEGRRKSHPHRDLITRVTSPECVAVQLRYPGRPSVLKGTSTTTTLF